MIVSGASLKIDQCPEIKPTDSYPESLIAVNQLGLALQQSERNNKELVDTLDIILKENNEMADKLTKASKMIMELVRIIEDLKQEKST